MVTRRVFLQGVGSLTAWMAQWSPERWLVGAAQRWASSALAEDGGELTFPLEQEGGVPWAVPWMVAGDPEPEVHRAFVPLMVRGEDGD